MLVGAEKRASFPERARRNARAGVAHKYKHIYVCAQQLPPRAHARNSDEWSAGARAGVYMYI